jgi:uncharacterized protein (DUF362 family)
MKSRRDFVKTAATGALIAGAQNKLAFARAFRKSANLQGGENASKVVIARDPHMLDLYNEVIPDRAEDLLDRAMLSYTGKPTPVLAWKQIIGRSKRIGIKTNGLGGKGISTHSALVYAIADRLQQAGIAPGNIIIWDRNARDLQACGFTINTDPQKVRCFGSDVSGYEDAQESFGSVRIRLSKILTRECDMVIGVPILKDHIMSGVTFAMKNMYGVIDRPQDLHANNCCPAIADLNCIPAIREKVRFTIGDALSSVYDGGPTFHPDRLWYPKALVVGEDRVAIDQTAWQMLDRKRTEAGLKTLEAAGRVPRYIAVAADAQHNLGTNDPNRMHVVEI